MALVTTISRRIAKLGRSVARGTSGAGRRWGLNLAAAATVVAIGLMLTLPASAQGPTSTSFAAAAASPQYSSTCHSRAATFGLNGSQGIFNLSANWQCSFTTQSNIPQHAGSPKILYFYDKKAATQYSTLCIFATGTAGDYYSLYLWSQPISTWYIVGHTPPVITGPHVVAPSYNSLWTGSGTTLSSDCWDFTLTSHQHLYFGIIDTFQLRVAASLKGPCAETALALLEDGCSVSGISVASGITPATFQVGYTNDWAAA